jgi:hypothetical protein
VIYVALHHGHGILPDMGILNRLLGKETDQSDYSAPHMLRAIGSTYFEQWPENSERYKCWKPASILPAPKWAVKRAMKLCYAEWPEPIDWGIFSPFFMEFVDLALHLPQEQYNIIDAFRKRRIMCGGKENGYDPLLDFSQSSTLAVACTSEQCNEDIINVRDTLRRSIAWDPVDAEDHELDAVRRIVLESTVEYATLIQEWRFYILSIGRDRYIQKS